MKHLAMLLALCMCILPINPAGLLWTPANNAIMEDYSSPPMITPTVTLNSTGGPNWRFATQPLPAGGYRVIARLNCAANSIPAMRTCGIVLYDGVKVEGFQLLWDNTNQLPGLQVQTGVNVTSMTAVLHGPTYGLVGTGVTLQIIENATTRTFYYWHLGGFVAFYSEPAHTFLTPTLGGFGGIESGNAKGTFMSVQCMIWSNNNP